MEYRSPHIRMRDVARIYNALEVGIIITTGSGTIVWGNRYYSQLAQFDIQDYFGRNVREISRREDVVLPTASYIIDIVLKTRKPQTEIVRYRTEDYVLTTAIPIFDKNEEIDYIIYSITNYSELMRLRGKGIGVRHARPGPGKPSAQPSGGHGNREKDRHRQQGDVQHLRQGPPPGLHLRIREC